MTERRVSIEINGAVQGVGFRPFVYRLAQELNLSGWVQNDARGVFIEADGEQSVLETFLDRLEHELPAVASIDRMNATWLDTAGFTEFSIRRSDGSGQAAAIILPDLATCRSCLDDILEDGGRRQGYAFTNCTNCGPRFSIIRELPYDRPNTTMASFVMCADCTGEYEDPTDRRFHAQPNACPACGPKLSLEVADNLTDEHVLAQATQSIESGQVIALKGLGGFQLLCDATNAAAVQDLRASKHRPDKPLAVMVRDLDQARQIVAVDHHAAEVLGGVHAPIVLLPPRPDSPITDGVAPGSPTLGVMLPTTPLHHLLLRRLDVPVVATSGNLTDEPICTDNDDAMMRLGAITNTFVMHDRPIERHVDDSVVWLTQGRDRVLRRARGYAPMPIVQQEALPPLLATGAHLKNTIAISVDRNVFVSQHIGDLETDEAHRAFEAVIEDLSRMYDVRPVAVAHDLHPDYLSTRYALTEPRFASVPKIAVQHHHAHLASCLADNDVGGPALGVTWDGTGYGTDGTIWGGEFLVGDAAGFERVAHLRQFRLPGGEAAVREPRRCAAALLWEAGFDLAPDLPGLGTFDALELDTITAMLTKGINSPVTSSAGRLFDGIAAMIGVADTTSFEGQGAMSLENVATGAVAEPHHLPLIDGDGPLVVDWGPMVRSIVEDLAAGVAAERIAAAFHASLVEAMVSVARETDQRRVALTGGCFQNRLLTEGAATRLAKEGVEVLLHRRVPPNDGGISLGQIMVAAASPVLS